MLKSNTSEVEVVQTNIVYCQCTNDASWILYLNKFQCLHSNNTQAATKTSKVKYTDLFYNAENFGPYYFLATSTSASKDNSGILVPSLTVSLLMFSVLTFIIGFLMGILFTKWYLQSPE